MSGVALFRKSVLTDPLIETARAILRGTRFPFRIPYGCGLQGNMKNAF
jgi:hypothetical protein